MSTPLLKRLSSRKFISILVPLLLGTPHAGMAYDRIVSTTGNASEVIYDMGLNDSLVAVDTTSVLPAIIMSKKPKIGYRRVLSAEGILSMQPDLLILAPDAGPKTVVEQIKAAGINTVTIKDKKTINGVIDDIQMLAKTLHTESAAQPIIQAIRSDEKAIQQLIKEYPRKPRIAFFMSGATAFNSPKGLGSGTAGDAMITIVGGTNVFANTFTGLKSVSSEAISSMNMDMIIIASHGGSTPATEKMENITSDYGSLGLTKAAQNRCIFKIGTVQSLGFGPGVASAAKEIASHVAACISDDKK